MVLFPPPFYFVFELARPVMGNIFLVAIKLNHLWSFGASDTSRNKCIYYSIIIILLEQSSRFLRQLEWANIVGHCQVNLFVTFVRNFYLFCHIWLLSTLVIYRVDIKITIKIV